MVPGGRQSAGRAPYRVMLVEDSAVIRAMLTRALESDPQIEVVASVVNGEMAVASLKHDPSIEVVLLDIDMPVMDGLTALPLLLAVKPEIKIIMNSTLTRANANTSLKALSMGASDYTTKPSSSQELRGAEAYTEDLKRKVKALAAADRGEVLVEAPQPVRRPIMPPPKLVQATASRPPAAIAIGSSTGGPQALFKVLGGLPPRLDQPIFITQHMPPTFTALLAEHIDRQTPLHCSEARDGAVVAKGQVYLAPGDRHMLFETRHGETVIRLSDDPPENFCRPAVDPMLRSLAPIYGSHLLVLILTGMGSDGREGAKCVVEAGGSVIAQDEATSVVWGMPGSVATAGLCSAVLPLPEIAPYISKLAVRSAA